VNIKQLKENDKQIKSVVRTQIIYCMDSG